MSELALGKHHVFEEALRAAFPVTPLPALDWHPASAFEHALQEQLRGKPWPEAVGFSLPHGERDVSLSTWAAMLPLEVLRYYLPAHLLTASLLLPGGSHPNYLGQVMEALILPPGADPAQLAAIDEALYLEAWLQEYAASRRSLYHALSAAQRVAVAAWLDMYLYYRAEEFDPDGRLLFEQNRDYWLHSSLPEY